MGYNIGVKYIIPIFLTHEHENDFSHCPHDYYETTEKGHGRVEIRRYWVTDNIQWLEQRSEWVGLQSIGLWKITYIGSLKGKRKKAGWDRDYLLQLLAILFKF